MLHYTRSQTKSESFHVQFSDEDDCEIPNSSHPFFFEHKCSHQNNQSIQLTMNARLWLIILLLSVNSLGSESKRTDVAYASLLYGDEFLLGVRVLGKSIRDTRSSKDMVVLVSDGVSDYANNLLKVHSLIHFLFSITINLIRVYEWINLFVVVVG